MKDEMIPFEAKYIHQTNQAILVEIGEDEVWLPKSAIEFDEEELEGAKRGNTLNISIPERLATDKQLIY
jgi:hypothetical protein